MKTTAPFETWQAALPRRVATLARMAPLHRFEATKAGRKLALGSHDLRTLCLMVMDATIERMGLSVGASQEEIVLALKPLICAGEPNADNTRAFDVATAVLDFLLNEDERRRAFSEDVQVIENGEQVTREISFHYLQQVMGPNDEPLYRATVEGINLYTGTLGLDVEDAHAANAAVLKYQIGRGRFREAVATARQAVAISIGCEQKVRRALEIAKRDVTQINWADEILTTLAQGREHLRIRIDADNEILRAVEEHEEGAEAHEREHISELVDHIHACQKCNSALHVLLMGANETWLGEHTRQAFRARALGVLPDIEASILRRGLTLPDSQLNAETSSKLIAVFLPPSPPVVPDGRRLVDLLLAPPREHEADIPLPEPEPEELAHAPDRFTEQDYSHADGLLEALPSEGSLVSNLLRQARTDGHSDAVQTLLYLLVLRDYGEALENVQYTVESTDRCFVAEPFWGDDLFVKPPVKSAEEMHE